MDFRNDVYQSDEFECSYVVKAGKSDIVLWTSDYIDDVKGSLAITQNSTCIDENEILTTNKIIIEKTNGSSETYLINPDESIIVVISDIQRILFTTFGTTGEAYIDITYSLHYNLVDRALEGRLVAKADNNGVLGDISILDNEEYTIKLNYIGCQRTVNWSVTDDSEGVVSIQNTSGTFTTFDEIRYSIDATNLENDRTYIYHLTITETGGSSVVYTISFTKYEYAIRVSTENDGMLGIITDETQKTLTLSFKQGVVVNWLAVNVPDWLILSQSSGQLDGTLEVPYSIDTTQLYANTLEKATITFRETDYNTSDDLNLEFIINGCIDDNFDSYDNIADVQTYFDLDDIENWSVVKEGGVTYLEFDDPTCTTQVSSLNSRWNNLMYETRLMALEFGADPKFEIVVGYDSDSNSYYTFNLNNNLFTISVIKDGQLYKSAAVPQSFEINQWYTFKAIKNGNTLAGYVNDVKLLDFEVDEIDYKGSAYITIQNQKIRFDYIYIKEAINIIDHAPGNPKIVKNNQRNLISLVYGGTIDWSIDNIPSWLIVNRTEGELTGIEELEVSFETSDIVANELYSEQLVVVSQNNINSSYEIEFVVNGEVEDDFTGYENLDDTLINWSVLNPATWQLKKQDTVTYLLSDQKYTSDRLRTLCANYNNVSLKTRLNICTWDDNSPNLTLYLGYQNDDNYYAFTLGRDLNSSIKVKIDGEIVAEQTYDIKLELETWYEIRALKINDKLEFWLDNTLIISLDIGNQYLIGNVDIAIKGLEVQIDSVQIQEAINIKESIKGSIDIGSVQHLDIKEITLLYGGTTTWALSNIPSYLAFTQTSGEFTGKHIVDYNLHTTDLQAIKEYIANLYFKDKNDYNISTNIVFLVNGIVYSDFDQYSTIDEVFNKWQVSTEASWSLVDNKLKCVGITSEESLKSLNCIWDNVLLETRFTVADIRDAATISIVLGRDTAGTRGYQFSLGRYQNASNIKVIKDSVQRDIVTTDIVIQTTTYTFRAIKRGQILEYWLDGVKELELTLEDDTMNFIGSADILFNNIDVEFEYINIKPNITASSQNDGELGTVYNGDEKNIYLNYCDASTQWSVDSKPEWMNIEPSGDLDRSGEIDYTITTTDLIANMKYSGLVSFTEQYGTSDDVELKFRVNGIVSDDFETYNTVEEVYKYWNVTQSEGWSLEGEDGKIYFENLSITDTQCIRSLNSGFSNVLLETRFYIDNFGEVPEVFFILGKQNNNEYMYKLSEHESYVSINIDGQIIDIVYGSQKLECDQWYDIRIIKNNNYIEVYINGFKEVEIEFEAQYDISGIIELCKKHVAIKYDYINMYSGIYAVANGETELGVIDGSVDGKLTLCYSGGTTVVSISKPDYIELTVPTEFTDILEIDYRIYTRNLYANTEYDPVITFTDRNGLTASVKLNFILKGYIAENFEEYSSTDEVLNYWGLSDDEDWSLGSDGEGAYLAYDGTEINKWIGISNKSNTWRNLYYEVTFKPTSWLGTDTSRVVNVNIAQNDEGVYYTHISSTTSVILVEAYEGQSIQHVRGEGLIELDNTYVVRMQRSINEIIAQLDDNPAITLEAINYLLGHNYFSFINTNITIYSIKIIEGINAVVENNDLGVVSNGTTGNINLYFTAGTTTWTVESPDYIELYELTGSVTDKSVVQYSINTRNLIANEKYDAKIVFTDGDGMKSEVTISFIVNGRVDDDFSEYDNISEVTQNWYIKYPEICSVVTNGSDKYLQSNGLEYEYQNIFDYNSNFDNVMLEWRFRITNIVDTSYAITSLSNPDALNRYIFYLYKNQQSALAVKIDNKLIDLAHGSTVLSTDFWYEVKMMKNNNLLTIWVNGVKEIELEIAPEYNINGPAKLYGHLVDMDIDYISIVEGINSSMNDDGYLGIIKGNKTAEIDLYYTGETTWSINNAEDIPDYLVFKETSGSLINTGVVEFSIDSTKLIANNHYDFTVEFIDGNGFITSSTISFEANGYIDERFASYIDTTEVLENWSVGDSNNWILEDNSFKQINSNTTGFIETKFNLWNNVLCKTSMKLTSINSANGRTYFGIYLCYAPGYGYGVRLENSKAFLYTVYNGVWIKEKSVDIYFPIDIWHTLECMRSDGHLEFVLNEVTILTLDVDETYDLTGPVRLHYRNIAFELDYIDIREGIKAQVDELTIIKDNTQKDVKLYCEGSTSWNITDIEYLSEEEGYLSFDSTSGIIVNKDAVSYTIDTTELLAKTEYGARVTFIDGYGFKTTADIRFIVSGVVCNNYSLYTNINQLFEDWAVIDGANWSLNESNRLECTALDSVEKLSLHRCEYTDAIFETRFRILEWSENSPYIQIRIGADEEETQRYYFIIGKTVHSCIVIRKNNVNEACSDRPCYLTLNEWYTIKAYRIGDKLSFNIIGENSECILECNLDHDQDLTGLVQIYIINMNIEFDYINVTSGIKAVAENSGQLGYISDDTKSKVTIYNQSCEDNTISIISPEYITFDDLSLDIKFQEEVTYSIDTTNLIANKEYSDTITFIDKDGFESIVEITFMVDGNLCDSFNAYENISEVFTRWEVQEQSNWSLNLEKDYLVGSIKSSVDKLRLLYADYSNVEFEMRFRITDWDIRNTPYLSIRLCNEDDTNRYDFVIGESVHSCIIIRKDCVNSYCSDDLKCISIGTWYTIKVSKINEHLRFNISSSDINVTLNCELEEDQQFIGYLEAYFAYMDVEIDYINVYSGLGATIGNSGELCAVGSNDKGSITLYNTNCTETTWEVSAPDHIIFDKTSGVISDKDTLVYTFNLRYYIANREYTDTITISDSRGLEIKVDISYIIKGYINENFSEYNNMDEVSMHWGGTAIPYYSLISEDNKKYLRLNGSGVDTWTGLNNITNMWDNVYYAVEFSPIELISTYVLSINIPDYQGSLNSSLNQIRFSPNSLKLNEVYDGHIVQQITGSTWLITNNEYVIEAWKNDTKIKALVNNEVMNMDVFVDLIGIYGFTSINIEYELYSIKMIEGIHAEPQNGNDLGLIQNNAEGIINLYYTAGTTTWTVESPDYIVFKNNSGTIKCKKEVRYWIDTTKLIANTCYNETITFTDGNGLVSKVDITFVVDGAINETFVEYNSKEEVLNNWSINSYQLGNYELVKEADNQYLVFNITNSENAGILQWLNNEYENGIIRVRFYISNWNEINPFININFALEDWTNRYGFLTGRTRDMLIFAQLCSSYMDVTRDEDHYLSLNTWHTLEVIKNGNELKFTIDDSFSINRITNIQFLGVFALEFNDMDIKFDYIDVDPGIVTCSYDECVVANNDVVQGEITLYYAAGTTMWKIKEVINNTNDNDIDITFNSLNGEISSKEIINYSINTKLLTVNKQYDISIIFEDGNGIESSADISFIVSGNIDEDFSDFSTSGFVSWIITEEGGQTYLTTNIRDDSPWKAIDYDHGYCDMIFDIRLNVSELKASESAVRLYMGHSTDGTDNFYYIDFEASGIRLVELCNGAVVNTFTGSTNLEIDVWYTIKVYKLGHNIRIIINNSEALNVNVANYYIKGRQIVGFYKADGKIDYIKITGGINAVPDNNGNLGLTQDNTTGTIKLISTGRVTNWTVSGVPYWMNIKQSGSFYDVTNLDYSISTIDLVAGREYSVPLTFKDDLDFESEAVIKFTVDSVVNDNFEEYNSIDEVLTNWEIVYHPDAWQFDNTNHEVIFNSDKVNNIGGYFKNIYSNMYYNAIMEVRFKIDWAGDDPYMSILLGVKDTENRYIFIAGRDRDSKIIVLRSGQSNLVTDIGTLRPIVNEWCTFRAAKNGGMLEFTMDNGVDNETITLDITSEYDLFGVAELFMKHAKVEIDYIRIDEIIYAVAEDNGNIGTISNEYNGWINLYNTEGNFSISNVPTWMTITENVKCDDRYVIGYRIDALQLLAKHKYSERIYFTDEKGASTYVTIEFDVNGKVHDDFKNYDKTDDVFKQWGVHREEDWNLSNDETLIGTINNKADVITTLNSRFNNPVFAIRFRVLEWMGANPYVNILLSNENSVNMYEFLIGKNSHACIVNRENYVRTPCHDNPATIDTDIWYTLTASKVANSLQFKIVGGDIDEELNCTIVTNFKGLVGFFIENAKIEIDYIKIEEYTFNDVYALGTCGVIENNAQKKLYMYSDMDTTWSVANRPDWLSLSAESGDIVTTTLEEVIYTTNTKNFNANIGYENKLVFSYGNGRANSSNVYFVVNGYTSDDFNNYSNINELQTNWYLSPNDSYWSLVEEAGRTILVSTNLWDVHGGIANHNYRMYNAKFEVSFKVLDWNESARCNIVLGSGDLNYFIYRIGKNNNFSQRIIIRDGNTDINAIVGSAVINELNTWFKVYGVNNNNELTMGFNDNIINAQSQYDFGEGEGYFNANGMNYAIDKILIIEGITASAENKGNLGIIKNETLSTITLFTAGRTTDWTVSGVPSFIKLNKTSGTITGKEILSYVIYTRNLVGNTEYNIPLTFTDAEGFTSEVNINFVINGTLIETFETYNDTNDVMKYWEIWPVGSDKYWSIEKDNGSTYFVYDKCGEVEWYSLRPHQCALHNGIIEARFSITEWTADNAIFNQVFEDHYTISGQFYSFRLVKETLASDSLNDTILVNSEIPKVEQPVSIETGEWYTKIAKRDGNHLETWFEHDSTNKLVYDAEVNLTTGYDYISMYNLKIKLDQLKFIEAMHVVAEDDGNLGSITNGITKDIKLYTVGRTTEWSVSDIPTCMNFERTSGSMRDIYTLIYTIDTSTLTEGNSYNYTLTFTDDIGFDIGVEISFTVSNN